MRFLHSILLLVYLAAFINCKGKATANIPVKKLKALIIDGENSHGIWPKSTFMMKDYLEQTGLFEVDINRTTYNWVGPHHDEVEGVEDISELLTIYPLNDGKKRWVVDSPKPDPNFSPEFENYDVVISNFGWKSSDWTESAKSNFVSYIKNGGGLVVIHAANNAWGNWDEFNTMIGLGGWGGRDVKSGPYVFYNNNNEIEYDYSEGMCGSHGKKQEFQIQTRMPDHPIMKNLPQLWMHGKDELYERLRGPGKNITILATAYSNADEDSKRTGRHEPMAMTIHYGLGRVFHSTLGHMDYSMECVGFITTLQRGTEWAATGKVTQLVPEDFPTKDSSSVRKWTYKPVN